MVPDRPSTYYKHYSRKLSFTPWVHALPANNHQNIMINRSKKCRKHIKMALRTSSHDRIVQISAVQCVLFAIWEFYVIFWNRLLPEVLVIRALCIYFRKHVFISRRPALSSPSTVTVELCASDPENRWTTSSPELISSLCLQRWLKSLCSLR